MTTPPPENLKQVLADVYECLKPLTVDDTIALLKRAISAEAERDRLTAEVERLNNNARTALGEEAANAVDPVFALAVMHTGLAADNARLRAALEASRPQEHNETIHSGLRIGGVGVCMGCESERLRAAALLKGANRE